jgi:hypothetical protein
MDLIIVHLLDILPQDRIFGSEESILDYSVPNVL